MAKITSLAELTDVASDDLLVVVDKSDTSMSDSGTDKKVQKVNLLKGLVPENGWIPAGETWTYASADSPTFTFTISGDKTSKYSVGMKIKLTQTTVKYFIITAISYSSPNTTVTVYGGTDYTLANATITNPYYSTMKAPQGFPMNPDKWSVVTIDSTARRKNSPAPGTWYYSDIGSINISIPIGLWDLTFSCLVTIYTPSGVNQKIVAALSTSQTSSSDGQLRSAVGGQNPVEFMAEINCRKVLDIATKTSYYAILKTDNGGVGFIEYTNNLKNLIIRATCAYL